MARSVLFDLDMTLVDTSALARLRRDKRWNEVRAGMGLIRPFPKLGALAPHELPRELKRKGCRVGIVTSSPGWYARQIIAAFKLPFDVLVAYEDTAEHKPDPAPIQLALKKLGVPADPTVCYVGDDVGDVEAAYHAGVTSVGVSWGPSGSYEFSSAAPDVYIHKPSALLSTDHLARMGYDGECRTAKIKLVRHIGSTLICGEQPLIYALGRYFTASDPRHASSQLSAAILKLKNGDEPARVLGKSVGKTIRHLKWVPDYIVPVPPKPSQNRNRFEKLLRAATEYLPADCEVELSGLRCIKEIGDYKGMSPLQREEAIHGAFRSEYKWNKNSVLLVDDVYTTGSTTNECMKVLRANGASEVRVLCIAKDQRVFVRKSCSACGRSMKIRTNGQGQKFWGCSGFPHACRNTENL